MGMVALPRVALKTRCIDSPDILSSILEVPRLSEFLNSLYKCRYKDFMSALVDIGPSVQADRYLGRHASFFIREVRIIAYSQFLDAYKRLTIAGMAKKFGVSSEFLDEELARFIAAERLNAKIDKISGVVETTRPDAKNAQYHAILKHGDTLLNRIQRLSRVVNV
jgi:26S proteasome regulatory subunit N7